MASTLWSTLAAKVFAASALDLRARVGHAVDAILKVVNAHSEAAFVWELTGWSNLFGAISTEQ
jgi:hypothetical protein